MQAAGGSQADEDDGDGPRRPRSRRLPRSVRERQILDAAVESFAARGFHLASMDEISEFAGISKPMIYAYLGSKEELFIACIQREANRLIEAIGTAVEPDLRPDEQLWRGLRVFFDYVQRNRASWTILHRQAATGGEPFSSEFAQWRQQAMALISTLLARATESAAQPMQPQQMEPFAAALVGAGESLLDWWVEHPEHTADGLAMRLMNLAWMGFGDLVEGRSWSPRVPDQPE
ncbi:MAG: TetR/AcrR family transcriptional regulator [Saccharopolyspora sp.]|uniref:TetR/AcrR family transcriptional regulator n=1 Tax=Saccharopolyspora TaxID=1835 RepID=UPI00190A5002|nr:MULTISPECIES: TetR/AcrR family transcriptional regulator [unclassified Saccharopolyspora]MBK0865236.1 TetR/AcrR family transcriptional regulator [Saccharopolyspora sp. HNM0986]MBQ6643752.1 TetR/AcrR family transcriptional regulator [Saccharopolyspora sp.]